MRRGEAWVVSPYPDEGMPRVAVVVSNNDANKSLNRVQVVPLDTKVDPVYHGETLVSLNGSTRRVLTSQLATVPKRWLSERMGRILPADLADLEDALREQLDL